MIPKYQHIADCLRRELLDAAPAGTTKLPTEEKLCARFGVSRQTVRRALSLLTDEGLIRRRQGSGAYATGLHPNPALNQIAVLLPSDSDYTYARLRGELQAPFTREGYGVSFYLTEHSVARERFLLQRLQELPLRGLIVDAVKSALPNPNLDLYERLWAKRTATVFLHDAYENFPPRALVADDNAGGGYLLARHLIELRHSRIAGIFRSDARAGVDRYFGFVRACTDAGVPFDDSRVRWYTAAELLALQKKQDTGFLADFVRQTLGSCSAVICQDDEIAYWLVKELDRAGKNVPEDVSVTGFDNSYLCEFCAPPLTSLAYKDASPGARAAETLLAMLRGQNPPADRLRFQLVCRASCAPLP